MNSTDGEKGSVLRTIARILVPLVLIAAGGAAFAYFKSTGPRIERKPAKSLPAVVKVLKAAHENARIVVKAMGTVTASGEITLKARVSGEVRMISPDFVDGGLVKKGDVILRLDDSDYRVELQKAESALEKTIADLAIEQGNQTIAREELRLMSENGGSGVKETELALREPQLKQAKAAVASARADLARVQLSLGRTVIRAPFNALVIKRNINLGSNIGPQDSLATLVDTNAYWVRAAVPLDRLQAIEFNGKGGSPAAVRSATGGVEKKGRAVRVTGRLSERSRMATVIVRVPDPLGLESGHTAAPLLLDDYVTVEIAGRELNSIIPLPRSALRDQGRVWVYEKGRLGFRKVAVAWKEEERILVESGLAPGDRVILSDLPTPVAGMRLSLHGEAVAEQGQTGRTEKRGKP